MEMLYNDFVIRIIKMKMCIDTMDMTSGSLGKRVFRFSIPLILLNLLQVSFNMSDIAVVGKFSGAEALGAIGSTYAVYGISYRNGKRSKCSCGKIHRSENRYIQRLLYAFCQACCS